MPKINHVTVKNRTYTLQRLAQQYHLPLSTIRGRYYKHKRGMDLVQPMHIKKVEIDHHPYTFKQLSRKYHLPVTRLWGRYNHGYRGKDILGKDKQGRVRARIHGKEYSLRDISRRFHIHLSTLRDRYYQQGKRDEELLTANHLAKDKSSSSKDESRTPSNHRHSMSRERGIQLLQQIERIHFSDEQLRILGADYQHPIVVNACAGSGKTTIFVYRAILNMLIGKSNGNDTLGITFSKDAQLEMQQRFYRIRKQLLRSGVEVPALVHSRPKFLTFHALFFRLLKQYQPDLNVLPNAQSDRKFTSAFYRILYRSHYDMDNKEVLKQIFTLKDELIDRGWSNDGLNVPAYADASNPIQAVAPQLNVPGHTDKFFRDYLRIIRTYRDMKRAAGLVDFTDMKVLLYRQLTKDKQAEQFYLGRMKKYHYVFLDEFQDIDRLQWKLMKLILSARAQRNLFVIGDDDQAIYGFRGGSARYIIDFSKDFPHAKEFHLSTNYRTDARVLNVAKPMIQHNPVRIDKQLRAAPHHTSKIYTHHDNRATTTQNDPIFYQLLRLAKDPQVSADKIGVLVRHNATRSMVADFLANHGIYADLSHDEFILQYNKIYTTYRDLMYAMLYDDFDAFYHHATEIGFRKYRQHIQAVVYHNQMHLNRISKLSIYGALSRKTAANLKMKELDSKVIDCLERAQKVVQNDTESLHDLLSNLYYHIHGLVDSYYGYMVNRQFISSNDYQMATGAFRGNLLDADLDTIADFFQHEERKAHRLNEVVKEKRPKDLDILTLHQAKGLQYPYVFLIGLNDTDFDDDSLVKAGLFPSDFTYKDFMQTLYDHQFTSTDRKNKEEKRLEKLCYRIWHTSKDEAHHVIPATAFENVYRLVVGHHYPPQKDDDRAHFITERTYVENHGHPIGKLIINTDDHGNRITPIVQYIDRHTGEILPVHQYMPREQVDRYYDQIQSIYRDIVHQAAFVESERRLLYVGITRSQGQLYIDIPASPSPLLRELDLSASIEEHNFDSRHAMHHSEWDPSEDKKGRDKRDEVDDKKDKSQIDSPRKKSSTSKENPAHKPVESSNDFSIDQLSQAIMNNSSHPYDRDRKD